MKRFRPYRNTQDLRDSYADVYLTPSDFIYPYFVVDGSHRKEEISTMPDVYRFSIDLLIEDIKEITALGINKVLLFGVVDSQIKDSLGTQGYAPDNLVSRAVREIKSNYPDLIVITDVCLCEYTDHGHCGLIKDEEIDNDSTLPFLAEMAYQHALAGADFVAPSSMMDGQVLAIRQRLIKKNLPTKILGYSAKYASSFYGPFRDAAASKPAFGDRKSYQMDFRTQNQGVEEVLADIEEGADWVMVKPAMCYLDMVYRVSQTCPDIPLVAYQVSGEYAMLMHAAHNGYFDEQQAFFESLTAIKRAGANYIISYYAKQFLAKQ